VVYGYVYVARQTLSAALAGHSHYCCVLSLIPGGFIHNSRDVLESFLEGFLSDKQGETYLSLISSRSRYGEYVVLDAACSQMVQDSVIWHGQHTIIILHRCCRVQDRLA